MGEDWHSFIALEKAVVMYTRGARKFSEPWVPPIRQRVHEPSCLSKLWAHRVLNTPGPWPEQDLREHLLGFPMVPWPGMGQGRT